MKGWIKIHRKIQDHWVWHDERYFRFWMIILLNVNHECKKFSAGGEIFVCGPGQSFRSIRQWTELFGCSKPTTIKFFALLKNDGMITTQTIGKGNRRKHLITVENWQEYQEPFTEDFIEKKPEILPKVNPRIDRNSTPNKNEKNNKRNKVIENEQKLSKIQKEFYDSLTLFVGEFSKETLREFYNYWSEPNHQRTKLRWQMEKTWDTKGRLTKWVDKDFRKPTPAKKQEPIKPEEGW